MKIRIRKIAIVFVVLFSLLATSCATYQASDTPSTLPNHGCEARESPNDDCQSENARSDPDTLD